MDSARKDRIIASAVTILVVGLTLIVLLLTGLQYDERLVRSENPMLDQEEVYLDPELLLEQHQSIGEPDAIEQDAPAQEVKGEPAPAETEQPHTVTTGENTKPAPEQQLIARESESSVTNVAANRKKDEEKVATSMSGKFSGKSGSVAGKFDSSGSSDNAGSGVTGRMNGRQFLGCPLPDVTLSHKTTVTVSITVDADGHVTSATASGAATRTIRKKCEEAAMQARWSAKKGAPATRGTITFTIIPK